MIKLSKIEMRGCVGGLVNKAVLPNKLLAFKKIDIAVKAVAISSRF